MEDFKTMPRKKLQALCKKHGVPANLKNAEMAARLTSLLKDDEPPSTDPSGSGGGSGEVEIVKVVKKKVRFHPENDVYEFVDIYMEVADKEITDARRERANRRRGLRENGSSNAKIDNAVESVSGKSEEIISNRVRSTRFGKSVAIVSLPHRKRAKRGGKDVSATVEKESCGDSDIVDSFVTNASKMREFADVNDESGRSICGLREANSVDSEHIKSGTEVPRRTRTQRNIKKDDTLFIGSDDATKPVTTEPDLLAGSRDSVHDAIPLRKSCRLAMNNICDMPENQKRKIGEVFKKQVKKKPRKEFTVVIPDAEEINTLAREEEMNVNQIFGKPLRSKLSASNSPTVAEVDSGKEHLSTCESSEVELPAIKPLRRSRRNNNGYDALGLSDENSLPAVSSHLNKPLKRTGRGETEFPNEAVTNNVTSDCSLIHLTEDLDDQKKHSNCRKRSARLIKGVSESLKSCHGENNLLKKTDVQDSKGLSSVELLGITETVKDGICSAQHMTPSGSKPPDGSVEACVRISAPLLEKLSTICTVDEALANSTKSLSVPAVEESQITAWGNNVVQRQSLTAGSVQRGFEFEEPDNPSEFSNSDSYGVPQAGSARDEVSLEAKNEHVLLDSKHDHDALVSSEIRTRKCLPTEGVSGQDEALIVLYKSPSNVEDAHEIIKDLPITREVISKEDTWSKIWSNMSTKPDEIDDEHKETLSGNAEESSKERLAFLNEESSTFCRSNKDNETGEQDRMASNERQLIPYMPVPEVVYKLYGYTKIDEMASEDHSSANEQEQHSCIRSPYNAEGKLAGNQEQNLGLGRSWPEHELICNELYYETRNTESVSHDQVGSQLDGRSNICEYLDAEEVNAVQFSEPLKLQHHLEEDSIVGVITMMDDSTSEAVVLSTEAGSAVCKKDSLSPFAAIDENDNQELNKETNNSLLRFSSLNLSGDAEMIPPPAMKKEFAQDGHGANINEVSTALHVTNSELEHSGNVASDDGNLVSSDYSPSFRESQVERDAEITDVVDYSSMADSPLTIETSNVDNCTQDPNANVYLNRISQDLNKEFASEYMEKNRLSLYNETSQPEEVIASSMGKDPCPDDILNGEEAIDESNIDDYSIAKKEVKPKDRQTHDTRGYLDNAEELSTDMLSHHDAELFVMQENSEAISSQRCQVGTDIGDQMSVGQYACEDYGLKSSSNKKEIIKSSNTHVSCNDVGMARESASGNAFPSLEKLDGLLQEIDDYFEWRNSEEEEMEKSVMGQDKKEKALNSNVETYFEVPIITDYGRNGHMNECKCIAGLEVEVYASPLEGHGEQINVTADYEHVEERCSEERGLSGDESGRNSVKFPDVIQTSPIQSVICSAEKIVEFGSHQSVAALQDGDGTSFNPLAALENDVHFSDEQNANGNPVTDGNQFEGIKEVQSSQIISTSAGEAEKFEPSHGLVAQHILHIPHCAKNNQEPTPSATNDTLDLNKVAATTQQKIAKGMKENITPFSKTESMKRTKSASVMRRRVLGSLQNN